MKHVCEESRRDRSMALLNALKALEFVTAVVRDEADRCHVELLLMGEAPKKRGRPAKAPKRRGRPPLKR